MACTFSWLVKQVRMLTSAAEAICTFSHILAMLLGLLPDRSHSKHGQALEWLCANELENDIKAVG